MGSSLGLTLDISANPEAAIAGIAAVQQASECLTGSVQAQAQQASALGGREGICRVALLAI